MDLQLFAELTTGFSMTDLTAAEKKPLTFQVSGSGDYAARVAVDPPSQECRLPLDLDKGLLVRLRYNFASTRLSSSNKVETFPP